MPLRQGVRDLFLYIVIGIALITTVLLLAVFVPNISHTWFIFVWATVFLCLFISKMYWHQRQSGKLWILLGVLLATHITLYAIAFGHFPDFSTSLFLLTVPIEIMLIAAIVKLCLNVMPKVGPRSW